MHYQARFHQLLNYIDTHLDEELSVETLSRIACLSKYHFHRQFSALFGITAFSYIRQARMKRASYQLAFKKQMRIIDIAVANGYESSEAFSRAFSKAIGQSPSQFRGDPQWSPWYEKYQGFKSLNVQRMQSDRSYPHVEIVDFSAVKVASITHLGPIESLGHTINIFINWRKKNKLPPELSRTFNIIYDDPEVVEPDKHRCEICVSIKSIPIKSMPIKSMPIESTVQENDDGIIAKVIPAGRCALIRHIGSDDTIREDVSYLYSQWLVQSGEELRDDPLFFERVTLFPDVPEAEIITDIYLPLK